MILSRRIFRATAVSVLFVAPILLLAQMSMPTTDTSDTAPTMTEPEPTPTDTSAMTEPDTTPPEILSATAVSTEPEEIMLAYTTDELAYGYIEYGESVSYGTLTPKGTLASLEHMATLSGLKADTLYYYRIVVEDEAGNRTVSEPRSVTTAAEPEPTDEEPPVITDIEVTDITLSGATISFTADEAVLGRVEYGTSEAYGSATPLMDEYASTHSFPLSGLSSDTLYHYRIIAEDETGNDTVSADNTFRTHAPPPPEKPTTTPTEPTAPKPAPEEPAPAPAPLAISNVETVSLGTSTARVSWDTNHLANGQIRYGTDETYASASPLSSAYVTAHEVKLSGLSPNTHYYYKVVSQTAEGESAFLAGFEFTTLAPAPVQPAAPVISGVTVDLVATSSAKIHFLTSTPTRGEVAYGLTSGYELGAWRGSTLETSHTAPLSGLLPDTLYHFQILARDAYAATAVSKDYTFKTSAVAVVSAPASPASPTPPAAPKVEEAATTETPSPAVKASPLKTNAEIAEALTFAARSGGGGDTPPIQPVMVKVAGLDRQVTLRWLRSFKDSPIVIRIVRNTERAPKSPTDGTVIFEGKGKTFTDTGLTNGTMYHYALYTIDGYGRVSPAMKVRATPQGGIQEAVIGLKKETRG